MTQLHKQLTADQVKVLLASYAQGQSSREEIEHTLGIGRSRFFALLKQFRHRPESLSLASQPIVQKTPSHQGTQI